jgi:P-type Ca2+ transporter type 2C
MPNKYFNIKGLTSAEVLAARKNYGTNILNYKKESSFFYAIKSIVKEPMFILLFMASSIYFVSGKFDDGLFLSLAVILVIAMSLFQDFRSRNALKEIKEFTQSKCKAIRNGDLEEIKSEDVVVGDFLMFDEGKLIVADGEIVHANDFFVNESILTGESLAIRKNQTTKDHTVYRGTIVTAGLAIVKVNAVGNLTKFGAIANSLAQIKEEKTPLELQITSFIKKMIFAGGIVFFVFWGINYFHSTNILDSLLKALTLAMSIIPEEIPVAFTTFMAMGAWRMMKMGIVVKQMKTVETLGSATVICIDKTGTITQNKMSLARIFLLSSNKILATEAISSSKEKELISTAMWASEPIPFDAMEMALHQAYCANFDLDERVNFKMVHEYPLEGNPPMMTHIFENKAGKRLIAAKGAAEALFKVSKLSDIEKDQINQALITLANDGYRVLAIGSAAFEGNQFPKSQLDFKFQFIGLVAFYDPPKKNINQVLEKFYRAGIAVKIITGDGAITTTAIANQIQFKGADKCLSGDELMRLTDAELSVKVLETNVFTRMFPEAKLRIINALKSNQEIVAMTGDGVNDGPALKAAHIGIAMGTKGTEIAKDAANLILVENDLDSMVDAIAMGRKIYTNLKKAIQYIISIHIPIILTVFIPMAFAWKYPTIFFPIHIILLELIMGPTCSIIFENEPIEKNTMIKKPRPYSDTFFDVKELTTSLLQGLVITLGTLAIYLIAVQKGLNEDSTRTLVFTTLITANIFLTLVNRSFFYSIFTTLKYKNNLIGVIIVLTIVFLGCLLFFDPLVSFFLFQKQSWSNLLMAFGIGLISVAWYELVKWYKRINNN